MRAILAACLASIMLYVTCMIVLLDRPLTNGMLVAELDAKLARGAATHRSA